MWEAGGPAAISVSAGLPEALGCWGGWGDFLSFPLIFFKKRFIGVVCRSAHVEGRGSELNSVKLLDLEESSPHSRLQSSLINLERKLEEQSERDCEQNHSK